MCSDLLDHPHDFDCLCFDAPPAFLLEETQEETAKNVGDLRCPKILIHPSIDLRKECDQSFWQRRDFPLKVGHDVQRADPLLPDSERLPAMVQQSSLLDHSDDQDLRPILMFSLEGVARH